MAGIVTAERLQQFREQGYFILGEFFLAEEIDQLREHIDTFAEAHEVALQKTGREGISRPKEISFTAHLAERDPVIRSFIAQEKFVDITFSILKSDISLYWDQSVYKKPETVRDFPWHQDTGYVPTDPAEYVTCWLALDDVPQESGCIWVLPGAHKQGMIEHQDTEIGKQCYFGDDLGIAVPLKKGSMVVFSSLLFHRSGPNLSKRVRKGYVIQYSVAHAKHAITGEPFNRLVIARDGLSATL
jgi:ectoine hydroxylase-related dioxygenase (phytanoyl-CoA dioxygenase family)